MKNRLGVLGFPLGHSQSPDLFSQIFKKESIQNYSYEKFEYENCKQFLQIVRQPSESIVGFNVTLPHKQNILTHLDFIDAAAEFIGAVNTVLVKKNNQGKKVLLGYNTDVIGFDKTLNLLSMPLPNKALVMGNGGASKAVQFVLKNRGVDFEIISRAANYRNYHEMIEADFQQELLIVNTTTLGMYPNVDEFPDLPYHAIDKKHACIDLIYNPAETEFLKKCKAQGAQTINGEYMLKEQAWAAWLLFSSEDIM